MFNEKLDRTKAARLAKTKPVISRSVKTKISRPPDGDLERTGGRLAAFINAVDRDRPFTPQDRLALLLGGRLLVLKLAGRSREAISFRVLGGQDRIEILRPPKSWRAQNDGGTQTNARLAQDGQGGDMVSLQQEIRQANGRYVSRLSDTTLEAYVHLDGYAGLTDRWKEAVFVSLLSEFAKRKGRTVVHLVSRDSELTDIALKIGESLARGKTAQFTTDDKRLFLDKPPVHLLTKINFQETNPRGLYPDARFVTIEDIQIRENSKQANVFAPGPVVIFMEQVAFIDEFSENSKSFQEARRRLIELRGGQDVSFQDFVDALQGLKLIPIPPAIRALDIHLALRVWTMAARMAGQAA